MEVKQIQEMIDKIETAKIFKKILEEAIEQTRGTDKYINEIIDETKETIIDEILIRFNFAEEVNNNILLKIYEDGETIIKIKKESSVYGDILKMLKEKRILK